MIGAVRPGFTECQRRTTFWDRMYGQVRIVEVDVVLGFTGADVLIAGQERSQLVLQLCLDGPTGLLPGVHWAKRDLIPFNG